MLRSPLGATWAYVVIHVKFDKMSRGSSDSTAIHIYLMGITLEPWKLQMDPSKVAITEILVALVLVSPAQYLGILFAKIWGFCIGSTLEICNI